MIIGKILKPKILLPKFFFNTLKRTLKIEQKYKKKTKSVISYKRLKT